MPKKYFKKRQRRPKAGNDEKMTFSKKIIPTESIVCIITGSSTLLVFLLLSLYSSINQGEGGILVGGIGMLAFLIAGCGFVFSLKTLRKDNIFLKLPLISTGINAFALILYIILYSYGLILKML